MKQINRAFSKTPIDAYRVSSKGNRHIRTIIPGGKSKHDPKPGADDNKPDKPQQRSRHYLYPVKTTPWMNMRWAKKKTMIKGNITTRDAAISEFHSVP